MKPHIQQQQGLALPVMLIMLVFMLASSVYLFKSTNSTALTTSNLAYDDAMSRSVDAGILEGFNKIRDMAATHPADLNANSPGYNASYDVTREIGSPQFWDNSATTLDAAGNEVEFVVHRMCSLPLPYHNRDNRCVHTGGNSASTGRKLDAGDSHAIDAPDYMGPPQVHYMITARIYGKRGGNVINQAVVVGGA